MSNFKYKNEVEAELTKHIIPFWNKLRDDEFGGFYGYVSHDLKLDKNADKGCILHSRILWFYSNAYLLLKDENLLRNAKHCYEFMVKFFYDNELGGVYWMVDNTGKPVDMMKHIYCQAFFVYALSSYYLATNDENAIKLALEVFEIIEEKGTDEIAYLEALSRDFNVIHNDALSENGLHAEKTMNTTLHLMEAYTELYIATKDKRVYERLHFIVNLIYEKIFDRDENKLFVFFDKRMNVIGDIHSYGHDIEATWLIDRACDVLGDDDLSKKITEMNKRIVRKISEVAFDGRALLNERDGKHINRNRVWWVQAESVVGFLNAYKRYGDEKNLEIADTIWEFIHEYLIHEQGEWISELDEHNKSIGKPETDPWKCPYHNGRMCFEVLRY